MHSKSILQTRNLRTQPQRQNQLSILIVTAGNEGVD